MRKGLLRPLLTAGLLLLLVGAWFGYRHHERTRPWTEWQQFSAAFINEDGRVVDRTANSRSTSEGQAYALFFALAANDRAGFEQILLWTRNNLSSGDLTSRLPAWLWGQKPDGAWGIIDENSASDADLWMAYALMEAGRLWQVPRFAELGRSLLWQVQHGEVAEVSQTGPMLIPGLRGFRLANGNWRLNPSYLPEFQLRYFAQSDSKGPWNAVWANHEKLMALAAPQGIAPDWYEVNQAGQAQPDSVAAPAGSYDAIRVYLWAGMTPEQVGQGSRVAALAPFRLIIEKNQGLPPERVQPGSGLVSGGQPLGFSAAVLPFLKALGDEALVQRQTERLRSSRVEGQLGPAPAHYYDQVLALFGEGWMQKHFRFDPLGRLEPRWNQPWFAL